ncbi:hypothetical protein FACS1894110_12290 [Spirochaetia bacterium]|nr:hypothetical protein FACS1894110_12290 [Spirochaetia bacterium]
MSLFCLLWTPLFYLFKRSVSSASGAGSGGVWALLLGSIVALTQFFLGSFVNAGGFGLSRWVSGCIDIVTLPAVLPLLVYLLLIGLRLITGTPDFTNFALLWLIPGGALRAVSWSAQSDPILLVLVPLLWTAIVVGLPFFVGPILDSPPLWLLIPSALGALVLPLLAATVYWAFFSQRTILGFLLLFVIIIPLVVSMVHGMMKE